MQEERRSLDPTRTLLKIFGVKVTDYEERTAKLLAQGFEGRSAADLLELAAEVVDLTADLNGRLRERSGHVLERESQVLAELKAALQQRDR